MADMINFTGKKNKNWLNQFAATSGNIPSAAVIDQMIQAELDAAYKNRYYSGALQLQQNKLDADTTYQNKYLDLTAERNKWEKEKGLIDLGQREKDRESARSVGLLNAGTGLATTALGLWGKSEPRYDETGKITGRSSDLGDAFTGAKNKVLDFSRDIKDRFITPSTENMSEPTREPLTPVSPALSFPETSRSALFQEEDLSDPIENYRSSWDTLYSQ